MSIRLGRVWMVVGAALGVSLLVRPLGVFVALTAVAGASGLILFIRAAGRGDLAFGILSLATRALQPERADWAEAMLAELAQVSGRWGRMRFAIGCAGAALLPPPRPGRTTQAARIVVAATVLAITSLFFYSRNRLIGATVGSSTQGGAAGIPVDLLVVGAVAASAMIALVRFRPTSRRAIASRRYGVLGGLIVGGAVLVGSLPGLMVQDVNGVGANGWFVLAALATTLAVGVAAGLSSHDARAGKEAGWWAGVIGGAILFVGLLTLSYTSTTWFTHDPASIHASQFATYPGDQPHFKTIAAQILNSQLDTAAFGIFVLPILGLALGALGGTVTSIRHSRATRTD